MGPKLHLHGSESVCTLEQGGTGSRVESVHRVSGSPCWVCGMACIFPGTSPSCTGLAFTEHSWGLRAWDTRDACVLRSLWCRVGALGSGMPLSHPSTSLLMSGTLTLPTTPPPWEGRARLCCPDGFQGTGICGSSFCCFLGLPFLSFSNTLSVRSYWCFSDIQEDFIKSMRSLFGSALRSLLCLSIFLERQSPGPKRVALTKAHNTDSPVRLPVHPR